VIAWLTRGARAASIAVAVSTMGCGSGGDDGGSGGAGAGNHNQGTCDLALTLSGDSTFHSDLDDSMACLSTIGSGAGAYVAYAPTANDEVTIVELSLPELMATQTGNGQRTVLTITLADDTEFSLMGCTATISQNSFVEMDEFASRYHVVGEGSCPEAAVNGTRSISVVGFFRFVATLGWAN